MNLSENEKTSIEWLKNLKDFKRFFSSSYYVTGSVYFSEEEKQYIDTILDIINRLEEENNELKEQNLNFIVSAATETFNNTTKNLNDLDLLNRGWKQEVEIKDKVIDELCSHIDHLTDIIKDNCDEDLYLEPCSDCDLEMKRCLNNTYKECIKNYFYEKVENNK